MQSKSTNGITRWIFRFIIGESTHVLRSIAWKQNGTWSVNPLAFCSFTFSLSFSVVTTNAMITEIWLENHSVIETSGSRSDRNPQRKYSDWRRNKNCISRFRPRIWNCAKGTNWSHINVSTMLRLPVISVKYSLKDSLIPLSFEITYPSSARRILLLFPLPESNFQVGWML